MNNINNLSTVNSMKNVNNMNNLSEVNSMNNMSNLNKMSSIHRMNSFNSGSTMSSVNSVSGVLSHQAIQAIAQNQVAQFVQKASPRVEALALQLSETQDLAYELRQTLTCFTVNVLIFIIIFLSTCFNFVILFSFISFSTLRQEDFSSVGKLSHKDWTILFTNRYIFFIFYFLFPN